MSEIVLNEIFFQVLIEKVVALWLIFLGISYVANKTMWMQYIEEILKTPYKALPLSLIILPIGLASIFLHNIWLLGWPVMVTLFAWLVTLKAALFLCFPNFISNFFKFSNKQLSSFITFVGYIYIAIGFYLAWQVLI